MLCNLREGSKYAMEEWFEMMCFCGAVFANTGETSRVKALR